MTASKLEVRELTAEEINWVSGGEGSIGAGPKEVKSPQIKVTPSGVLVVGAAITALGAAALVAVGSPILLPAAAAYGLVSAGMGFGGAMLALAGK